MIKLIKLICKLCGYSWSPKFERMPVQCPQCKRYRWNKKN